MATESLIQKSLNGMVAYYCPDCGRWAYEGQKIKHSSRCDHNGQPSSEPSANSLPSLSKLASKVRATGLCGGRHEDVYQAAKRGYLSQSDAMNTDD